MNRPSAPSIDLAAPFAHPALPFIVATLLAALAAIGGVQ